MLLFAKLRSVIVLIAIVSILPSVAQNEPGSVKKSKVQNHVSVQPEVPHSTSALAMVVMQPSKLIYSVGESITATVSLVAGNKGVYISRHVGIAMGNVPGFSLWLEYLDGQSAQTCGGGGFRDIAGPLPSPADVLKNEFIFLKPSEERKSEMGISCPPNKPGAYRLRAAYSPNYPQTEKVADLPETHRLVLHNRIEADLVSIEIR